MILKLLQQTIGGIQVLQRHKNIYTAIVHTKQSLDTQLEEFDLQIIKMVEETPKFPIDFQLFSFTKTYCDAEFTTGNQILQFEDAIWPTLFQNNKEFQEIKGQDKLNRKNFVISKKLTSEQIMNHPFFTTSTFINYITKNQHISLEQQQLIQNSNNKNNSFVQEFENFNDAAKFFRDILGNEQRIFYDVGPQFLHQLLNLLDLYIITIYSGKLDEEFRVGQMPNFKDVTKHLKLTYKSERFEQHQGYIQFFVFEK